MIPEWLKRLYSHRGDFYALVGPGAIIMLDARGGSKETVLRLFLSPHEAERYRDAAELHDARVTKMTLVGLWSLLPRIDSLSIRQHRRPVRIEVSTFDSAGAVRAVDVFHSTYELLS